MDLRFDPSGTLTVYGGTHSHGQGHATVFAQLAHEMLGVPFEQIRYVQGDTAQVPIGRGTYGARSAVVGGNALKAAADAMIEKGKKLAAAMMEADAGDIEFKDGHVPRHRHRQGDPAGRRRQGLLRADGAARPRSSASASKSTGSFDPTPPSHPNGSHVCELEVDPETGEVSDRPLFRGRRSRPHAQSDDRARPDAGRRGAGHRPGADGAPGLRPRRAASCSPAASWTTPCRAPP